MGAKSENGNVRVVDYTAYPPPSLPPPSESDEKPVTPAATGGACSPAHEAMHKKVLEHFQSESYKIPGLKDGELLEVEKFWLVRVFFLFSGRKIRIGYRFLCL